MSAEGKLYNDYYEPKFYFPGHTSGQPHKVDKFRYCYTFFRKTAEDEKKEERFDYFLYRADKDINYFEPKFMPELRNATLGQEMNPYNPFGLQTEFKIQVMDDGQYMNMRDELKG
mmetsp:Transcript_18843/g.28976  ORF Transcript_18843/g.28976 Transcript_18843/m.28976 type:complete len:115 (+) Transcript_18843:143-487(+)|eukprot:CAMPEP_0170489398 /NCGR_PEP_ID=MMETSP0208-20121228/7754_1 /TAXON_ID=197538 /ORGANISM="Strombidium inclinatum, Strain S3" /LENGTH=114 /DNA_ID=CAMNT_0010764299 /DNA_START=139 /DNA_END=483 /DNA_ORIENTATION=-